MTLQTYDLDKKMLEYSISQFRNIPEYIKICECFAVGLGSIQVAVNYLSDMQNVDKAEGIWLDYLGWLVGITREYTDIGDFFCVNAPDVNETKYFWFKDQSQSSDATLSDNLFRRRIYGKIGYNVNQCTRNENIRIIKNITFAEHVIIEYIEPMTFDITLYGDNIPRIADFDTILEQVLGNGVGIRTLTIRGSADYE